MSLIPAQISLFTHPMFARKGGTFTVPSSGTVSETAKPGGGDTIWTAGNFGPCEEFKLAPESEQAEIMGGTPGGLVLINKITLAKRLKLSFTSQQLDSISAQAMFGTLALTSSGGQANPLEGDPMLKGWLKFQGYDDQGNQKMVFDAWGCLKVTDLDPWSGKNPFKAKFEFEVLYNTLNTITL